MKLHNVVLALLLSSLCLPAIAAAQQNMQAPSRSHPTPLEQIQGFHVVLVVGETEPGKSSTGNLTEAAARALKDMGEFLPYKSYRVLDAQWSSCCSGFSTRISGRLQGELGVPGPGGAMTVVHRPFRFMITASSQGTSGIRVNFVLTAQDGHGAGHPDAREEAELELKNAEEAAATLAMRAEEVRKRVDVGAASPLDLREAQDKVAAARREIEALRARMARAAVQGATNIMDSSFTMDPGETVVVGTSKLGGDKALIAVVTAVRKGGANK